MLGTGSYTVTLQHRGGRPIDILRHESITFGRELDTISEARIGFGPSSPSSVLGQRLAAALPWAHELAIARNGREVWVGPFLKPTHDRNGSLLMARDLAQWFERRWLPTERHFVDDDLGLIFRTLALDAYETDPSPNFTIGTATVGVEGDRDVDPSTHPLAGDALRELARDGVDFCTIGRHMRLGGGQIATPSLPPLTSDTLLDAQLEEDGLALATETGIIGQQAGIDAGSAATARYGGKSNTLGLVQRSFNVPEITDASSARAAARTRHDMLSTPPKYLTGRLSARYAAEFAQLVPGALVRAELYVGPKTVEETLRLASVSVNASAAGEEISVTLIPVGTEDLAS